MMAYNGYPAGRQSALHKGRQWRRLLRIEQAAILAIKGFSNDVIAAHIGVHIQTVIYLKQTPEFKARMIALSTGVLEQHDIAIREDEEYQRQQLKSMVPLALQKLKELAMSANQHISYKAAQDILDREGTHAKVSRSAIDIKEQVNLTAVNQVAANITAILTSAPSPPIDAAKAELDLGSGNDQDAITTEFTRGATDSTSQLYEMEEKINKDTVDDLGGEAVQRRLRVQ